MMVQKGPAVDSTSSRPTQIDDSVEASTWDELLLASAQSEAFPYPFPSTNITRLRLRSPRERIANLTALLDEAMAIADGSGTEDHGNSFAESFSASQSSSTTATAATMATTTINVNVSSRSNSSSCGQRRHPTSSSMYGSNGGDNDSFPAN
jgi:hypothetical protein